MSWQLPSSLPADCSDRGTETLRSSEHQPSPLSAVDLPNAPLILSLADQLPDSTNFTFGNATLESSCAFLVVLSAGDLVPVLDVYSSPPDTPESPCAC